MGREVRRVPKDWQHPKRDNGSYQPMYDKSFKEAAKEWKDGFAAWERGERPDYCTGTSTTYEYWEYHGSPPDAEYYRPHWNDEERTHFQMYENVSEGTPISPVMETPEELARWLADNNASAFAGQAANYESWLRVCRGGYAPSAVLEGGVMRSGVEALTN